MILIKIGLIGTGVIAEYLLKEINEKSNYPIKIVAGVVRNKDKYKHLEDKYNIQITEDINRLLEKDIDLIVEAATVSTVKRYLPKVIKHKDCLVISVGAFSDEKFLKNIYTLALENNHSIHLPSGAIGGLDLIQNAEVTSGLKTVKLTTRKPAHTFNEGSITKDKVIYQGSAAQAIEKYPKNINVAIILSLAGLGVTKTEVEIIASPFIKENEHTIEVNGEFGEMKTTIKNKPMPENTNTSYLAALSVLGAILRQTNKIKIGI
ncbi:MAG TPA: aspartate dehydrogenase [Pseudogracilibacillus sp.]|nr:aspartate dehydrogenase [Pseudogracilibacillus sp.]